MVLEMFCSNKMLFQILKRVFIYTMVPESLNPVTIVIGLLLLNSGLLEAQKDRTILEDLVGWERFGFSDCNLEKLINCLKINVEGSLQFIHELVGFGCENSYFMLDAVCMHAPYDYVDC